MPRSADPTTPQSILDLSIQACARQIAWRDLLRRVIVSLCGALLFALLLVVADHTWPHGLPRQIAIGASLVGLGLLGVVLLICAMLLLFRRLNPLFAARQLEQSLGVAHNTLINALLLRRQPDAAPVVQAATQRAARDLGEHPHVQVNTGGSRRTGILLTVTCLLWLGYALLSPKSVLQSLQRLFGASVAAPTVTQLVLLEPAPGSAVYAGEPLRIRVGVSGRIPDEVTFEFAPAERPAVATRYAMAPSATQHAGGSQDRAERELLLSPHEVTGDLTYTCRAGDARLSGVIRAQEQPDVLAYEIRLTPPAYTGQPEHIVTDPELIVWPGTEAVFHVVGNVPVRNPVFVFETDVESRARMRLDAADERRMTTSRRLTQEGRYRVEFADGFGYAVRHPRWHRVVLRRDEPPEVRVVSPMLAAEGEPLVDLALVAELTAEAADDIHVASLDLVVEASAGPRRLDRVGPSDGLRRAAVARVPAGDVALAEGERARAWFEARDNRVLADGTASPQIGRSRVFTLTRSAEPPAPEFQPEQRDGEPGQDQAASGDDSMDQEIPGSAQAGEPRERGEAGENPGGEPDSQGRPDSPEQQRGSPNDGGPPSDAQNEAERKAERQRFVQEHEEELRQIGEAMQEQERGDGAEQSGHDSENQEAGADPQNPTSGDQRGADQTPDQPSDQNQGNRQSETQGRQPSQSADQDAGKQSRPQSAGDDTREPPGQQQNPPQGQPRLAPQNQPDSNKEQPQVATPPGDQLSESREEPSAAPEQRQTESLENPPETAIPEQAKGGGQSGGPETQQGSQPTPDGKSGQAPQQGGENQPAQGQARRGDQPGENQQQQGGENAKPTGERGAPGEGQSPQSGEEQPPRTGQQSGKQPDKSSESTPDKQAQPAQAESKSTEQAGEHKPAQPNGERQREQEPQQRPADAPTERQAPEKAPEQGQGQAEQPDRQQPDQPESPGAGQAEQAGESSPEQSGGAEERPGDDPKLPAAQPLEDLGNEEPPPPPDRRRLPGDGNPDPAETLERLRRAGGVPPELEDELNWPREKAARFSRELDRLLQRDRAAGPAGAPARRRVDIDVGDDAAQAGRGVSDEASLRGDQPEARDDRLGKIAPPPDQRISPELRALLDAYYRAMARQRERRGP